MLAKIKKFFFSFLKLNKKTFLLLLFFIFLGALLPFYSAQAFIEPLARTIIAFLATWFFFVVATFAGAISIIPWLLLQFVTSPLFLNIPYATNEFVMAGWNITRGLANMSFILVLVVIALATILRIGDYQAKKALPLLIIIALLINFTPVITGVIIDFFNTLRDFFLGRGIGVDALFWAAEGASAGIQATIRDFDWTDFLAIPILIIAGVILIVISNLILALIFFFYTLIFMMRPLALMMLVILSPIAFLSYILPATRSFFTQWWNQFIQWCVIGVVAAFFLYLTDQLAFAIFRGELQHIVGTFTAPEGVEVRTPGLPGLIAEFVPIYLILGFMILGFFATITTSATGASHIIGFGKKIGNWAGQALAVKAGIVAAKKYPEVANKFAERAAKWSKGLEARGGLGGLAAKPLRWTERQATGLALHGKGIILKEEQKEEKRLTEKGVTTEERLRIAESGTSEQQVGATLACISEFESQDLLERLGPDELAKIRKLAKKQNLHKDIDAAFPHLYRELERDELEATKKELKETAGEQGREKRRELIEKQVSRQTNLTEEQKEIEIERQLTELEGLTEEQREERLKELIKEKKGSEALDSIFRRLSVRPDLIGRINKGAYETGDEDINNRLRQALEGNLDRALSTASAGTQNLIIDMYQKVITNATGSAEDKFAELVRRYPRATNYIINGPGARNSGLFLKTELSQEKEERILRRRGLPTSAPSEEEIKEKAHQIWQERERTGQPGTPEDDWRKAERILRGEE